VTLATTCALCGTKVDPAGCACYTRRKGSVTAVRYVCDTCDLAETAHWYQVLGVNAPGPEAGASSAALRDSRSGPETRSDPPARQVGGRSQEVAMPSTPRSRS
jgi:hypothetical protein